MSADHQMLVRSIHAEAIRLADGERLPYVKRRCGSDLALFEEVWRVVRQGEVPSGALGDPPPIIPVEPQSPDPIGRTIGSFKLTGSIGSGGFGVVYHAERDYPRQVAALKILERRRACSERDWQGRLRRFELEANILGHLDHPAMARIYEAGTTDIGFGQQPYFAMELIRGTNLLDYAAGRRVSGSAAPLRLRERLVLMARVAEAVHYAHQKGVIHRDLKPANILVTDDGQPKVLDFGVAHVRNLDLDHATAHTEANEKIGTLAYMSPEQARGHSNAVDACSDVYSLGVVLYELLTGHLPYHLRGKLPEQQQRIIVEDEPTQLRTSAGSADWNPRLSRQVRGDIETIVHKALAKEPERRYASAAAFMEDLRLHLAGLPITARGDSAVYVLQKYARKHAITSAVIAAVLTILASTAAISTHFYWGERMAREELSRQAEEHLQAAQSFEQSATKARAEVRNMALGWFLNHWHAGDSQRAAEIRDAAARESPEREAMQFLLDSTYPEERFLAALPATHVPLGQLIVGERRLRDGRKEDAREAFAAAMKASGDGNWYHAEARARLGQLGAIAPERRAAAPGGDTP